MPATMAIKQSVQKQDPMTEKKQSWQMFDRISHRYDFLNILLSAGIDRYWRRRLLGELPHANSLDIIDLATGTGDVAFMLYKSCRNRIKSIIGIDMSENMLAEAQRKKAQKYAHAPIEFIKGDAANLENIQSESCDAVTIAFGIRNIPNVADALSEMERILRPGGRAIILEFSMPGNKWIQRIYLFYFRKILPKIGALISGDARAYKYLNETVEDFGYGQTFCAWMRTANFVQVMVHPLTFGIASIYVGEKK